MPGVALGRRRLPEGWHHLEPKIETKIVRPPRTNNLIYFRRPSAARTGSQQSRSTEVVLSIFVRLFSSLCARMVFSSLSRGASKIASKTKTKTKLRSQTGPRIFRHTKDILVTLLAASGLHNFAQRHAMSTQRNFVETLRALRAVENCNWAFGAKIHGMASVSDPAPAPAVCLVARLIGCRRRCYGSHATRARCHAPLHCRPL